MGLLSGVGASVGRVCLRILRDGGRRCTPHPLRDEVFVTLTQIRMGPLVCFEPCLLRSGLDSQVTLSATGEGEWRLRRQKA